MNTNNVEVKMPNSDSSVCLLDNVKLALTTGNIDETNYDVSFIIWKSRLGRVDSDELNRLDKDVNLEDFVCFLDTR